MSHYIEIQNHYDNDLDEANGRVSKQFPLLALLCDSRKNVMLNFMHCTCPSIAQKFWGVVEIRDTRF